MKLFTFLKFFKVMLALSFLLFIFSFSSITLHSQIDKHMDNQTFWQWQSSSGSYAIHYIERGTGSRHILLLPGFASNTFTWRFVIDELAKAGYHVWTIDFLGSGLSDKPRDAPYGIQLFTNQITAFMEAKQIEHASLVGNSMGGGLALAMAIHYPLRIQALVLIDALAFPLKLPFYFSITQMLGKWSKPFMGKFMVKQILKEVTYDSQKISQEQIEAYSFPLQMAGGKDALIKTLQNFDQQELEELAKHFSDIKIPILIIWGKKDAWMPLSYFHQLAQVFPHAKTITIPNCGHIPQEECPVEVNKALLLFLKNIKA